MGNKKLLSMCTAIAATCMVGAFAACAPAGSGSSSGSSSSSQNTSSSVSMENVETIAQIPQSSFTVSAQTQTGTATSYWSIAYGDSALEATVYVEDAKVYKTAASIFGNDNVEIVLSSLSSKKGYTQGTISVIADVLGQTYVTDVVSGTVIQNSGVTATAKEFTLTGTSIDGWYVKLTIPYDVTTIDAAKMNAAVCIGMSNADSSSDKVIAYNEQFDTDFESVNTYVHVSADNTYVENPYHLKIDGKRENGYGMFTDTVLLDQDRWYNISALKTEEGVYVYSQGLFNTLVDNANPDAWGASTNVEFKLNGGNTSYVTLEQRKDNVSEFIFTAEEQDGKYLHTVEFFVESALIDGWAEDKDVQINYAWKTPNEKALLRSDMIYCAYNDWNIDFHSFHRLGGLQSFNFSEAGNIAAPANLFIGENGLTTLTPPENGPVIDGDLSEYTSTPITKGDASKATVSMNGKIQDGDLYVGFTVTHGAWSTYSDSWWNNDNIEMRVNGEIVRVFFGENGRLILPANVDAGKAVTIEQGGKNVTNVELYFEGNYDFYKVTVGVSGTGFGGWQSILWDNGNCAYVTEEGIYEYGNGASKQKPVNVSNGVVLDGVLDDSAWTADVKNKAMTTTANGADISVIARKADNGLLFGVTVKHSVATNQPIANSTEWWAYMGWELHFNVNNSVSNMFTCRNDTSDNVYSYCKTVDNGDGTYTSTFEVYIRYTDIGYISPAQVGQGVEFDVVFSIGGWIENGFAWLFGGDSDDLTHKVAENGLEEYDLHVGA